MRKIFVLSLTIISVLTGCTTVAKEPPPISIKIEDRKIEYVSAKNKWDGSVYDREDTFVTILKKQEDIPVFENGSIAEIDFKSNPPDKLTVFDIYIDKTGRQIYTDKETKNIPVELNNGKCTFEIEKHFAAALNSYYERDRKDMRGFRMIASWGENECEYAFVIKAYSKSFEEQSAPETIAEIDRSEYLTGEIIMNLKNV